MTRPTRATAAKNNQAAIAASTPAISESFSELLQQGRFAGIYVNHVNTINVHNHWPSRGAPDTIDGGSTPVDDEEISSSRVLTQVRPEFNEDMFQKAASKTGARISPKKPTTSRKAPDSEGSDDDENGPSVGYQIPAKGTGRTARTRSKTAPLRGLGETAEDPQEAPDNAEDQYVPTKSVKGYVLVSPGSIKVPESKEYQDRIEEARKSASEPVKTSRKTPSAKTSTSTKSPASKCRKGLGANKVKAGPKAAQKKAPAEIPASIQDLSPGKRRFSEVSTPFITYGKTDTPAVPSSSIERDFEEMRRKRPSHVNGGLTSIQSNEADTPDAALEEELEPEQDPPAKRKKDKHAVEKEDETADGDVDHLEDKEEVSPGNSQSNI